MVAVPLRNLAADGLLRVADWATRAAHRLRPDAPELAIPAPGSLGAEALGAEAVGAEALAPTEDTGVTAGGPPDHWIRLVEEGRSRLANMPAGTPPVDERSMGTRIGSPRSFAVAPIATRPGTPRLPVSVVPERHAEPQLAPAVRAMAPGVRTSPAATSATSPANRPSVASMAVAPRVMVRVPGSQDRPIVEVSRSRPAGPVPDATGHESGHQREPIRQPLAEPASLRQPVLPVASRSAPAVRVTQPGRTVPSNGTTPVVPEAMSTAHPTVVARDEPPVPRDARVVPQIDRAQQPHVGVPALRDASTVERIGWSRPVPPPIEVAWLPQSAAAEAWPALLSDVDMAPSTTASGDDDTRLLGRLEAEQGGRPWNV